METEPAKPKPPLPRILISHPERSCTLLLKLNLEDAYDVVTTNTGEETIELLDQPFSVIVITLIMPRIPGTEILKEIRRRGISTPVIIYSAAFNRENEESAGATSGVFGCIAQCGTGHMQRLKQMLDAAIVSQKAKSWLGGWRWFGWRKRQ